MHAAAAHTHMQSHSALGFLFWRAIFARYTQKCGNSVLYGDEK